MCLLFLGVAGISEAYTIVSQNLGESAYSASSVYSNCTPDKAFDGIWDNVWNAGIPGYPNRNAWIEVNLGQLRDVTRIVLKVEQVPIDLHTEHYILSSLSRIGTTTTGADIVATFHGETSHGQLLEAVFKDAVTAQFIQVLSYSTAPSWVAWNEIQIMTGSKELEIIQAAAPVPEPATLPLVTAGVAVVVLGSILRRRHTRRCSPRPVSFAEHTVNSPRC